jgi:hypothetical protein
MPATKSQIRTFVHAVFENLGNRPVEDGQVLGHGGVGLDPTGIEQARQFLNNFLATHGGGHIAPGQLSEQTTVEEVVDLVCSQVPGCL